MRSSTGPGQFFLSQLRLLPGMVIVAFLAWPAHAQLPPQPGAPVSDVSNIPKPATDTFDRIQTRDMPILRQAQESAAKDETCLLPPLTLLSSPMIASEQLRIPGKAKKEYHDSCLALRHNRIADAEKHLRKAVQEYGKYSAAWVTLGQVLAAQQRSEEAHTACAQASVADSGYVPAYLCLAELAARAHVWDEVLKLSNRALEIDAATDPVAYEYNAAANLNLHNLPAAEKSGLRALEIDRDHHEPRVYFVLAQIYEAKDLRSSQ
jgi:tetratricopeptide (TPR) repeat protein